MLKKKFRMRHRKEAGLLAFFFHSLQLLALLWVKPVKKQVHTKGLN